MSLLSDPPEISPEVCKYCLEDTAGLSSPLIYPCDCTNGVCESCFIKHLKKIGKDTCEICKIKFTIPTSIMVKLHGDESQFVSTELSGLARAGFVNSYISFTPEEEPRPGSQWAEDEVSERILIDSSYVVACSDDCFDTPDERSTPVGCIFLVGLFIFIVLFIVIGLDKIKF